MQNGLYVSLSSQLALDKRLSTIADNIANMSTTGFRATEVRFEDLVVGFGKQEVAFASSGETFLSMQKGALEQTNNPFDFAVRGEGWFAIETPAGMVMTRDGRFSMLQEGELVSIEGYPVLDAGGAPLQLNPAGGPPEVGPDGMIRQNGVAVGAIGVWEFEPGVNFERFGNSGIVPKTPPQPVVDQADAGVVQGYLEQANVNPILELTRLITLQRTFDNSAALNRDSEARLDDAIKTLGG
ncbi:flagellar basal-body rod protein FlgF [Limoniibacter endophyticus]|uniref:Flagellar basal-body rod protein FlgF n=1 Tax=Limoniibacter endophyticus TaxID=1565040 RepID=A0A8J3DGD8_9HYPH|nr:flagellar basal-body rod protein FlgF [Limoniibacter endophyticus]GHC64618.1 flagellar basal-body rod protein FlgF [Limoniibacter endophyticus]